MLWVAGHSHPDRQHRRFTIDPFEIEVPTFATGGSVTDAFALACSVAALGTLTSPPQLMHFVGALSAV